MIRLGAISLFLSLLFQLGVHDAIDVRPPVGQVYYLAKTDLLGEELIGGAPVLILNHTQDCFICDKSEIIEDDSTYFENTEAFYSSIAENYKLGAAFKEGLEFGSHVVTGVTYGSRMYQHCFSQSEQDYNERNFTVRACVAFSGGTDVTKTNISSCAGITQEEAEASSSLEVTTRLVIGKESFGAESS